MATIKKFTLEEFDDNDACLLIGIISSSPDFTLCWHINKHLNLNLKRIHKEIEIPLAKLPKKAQPPDLFNEIIEDNTPTQNISSHTFFKCSNEAFYTDYFMITNKGSKAFLVPDNKKVNYFLEIKGPKAEEDADELLFAINAIEVIEMAYLIDIKSLTSKLQLII